MNKLLENGIIRLSRSPWCSRIVSIKKKDGTLPVCVDYRPLNRATVRDKYPISRIDDMLNALGKAKIFSVLDATNEYHQIPVMDKDIKKTAFNWKGAHYEYNRMPFGLCNGLATFQRIMNIVLEKERWKCVIPYMDDIIVFSIDEKQHCKDLEVVLGKLRAASITLKKKKWQFFKQELKILTHMMGQGVVKPDPDKIKAITDYSRPENIKKLRSFLGLVNICRNFIKNFSEITLELNGMLKGKGKRSKEKITWSENGIKAFDNCRDKIVKITLRHKPDFRKQFILSTDASNQCIGAVLSQMDANGKRKMVHVFSKKLDNVQQNYSLTDKELLDVVKSIEYFKSHLIGSRFVLETDHRALRYFNTTCQPNSRLMIWSLFLQDFDFNIKYIPGDKNIADGFSRYINTLEKSLPQQMKRLK